MSFALLVLLATTSSAPANDELLLKIGEAAPPFAMRDLDNKVFSIRDHAGADAKAPKKAVLLSFFATWCKPCMKEIPIIKKLHGRWKAPGKDLEVVYVGMSQGAKELAPWAKDEKVPWRVVPDAFGLLARRYGASQLPHIFILDKEGKLAFQHRGIAPDLAETLEKNLERITGEEAPPDDESVLMVDKPRFDTTLKLGRAPSSPGSEARWQPLGIYLGEAAEANVEVMTEPSYEAFEKALVAGKYDIANAGPLLCLKAKALYEPVARLERQGSATYLGIIFAPRMSPIRTVADLKGKKLGLVSERSTSGGLYQLLALLDAGLDLKRDVKLVWLGSHSAVAAAVKDGTVDAGGCYEDCRDAVWGEERIKGAATRILAYTAEIPAEMIVVKKSLSPEVKKRLAAAILAIPEAQGILAQISQGEKSVTGFVKATDADLDAIQTAAARIQSLGPLR
ncbi:MAG: phosphate/phosphite/phosphonate ABC transporter substrate-binding protein [Deltaproteobacteria bacterium]|nr:phosphate/phosphite/phosphonate ABC transporter substrate-binding protein [Deltaproteobacteria bacterium]